MYDQIVSQLAKDRRHTLKEEADRRRLVRRSPRRLHRRNVRR